MLPRPRHKADRAETVWIFEQVGQDLSTGLILFWAWLTGGRVWYAQATPQSIARWQPHFPRERFGEIASRFAIQPDTHLKIYELVENRAEELERLPLYRALHQFFPHPKLAPTVRKALILDGFVQLMLSMEVEQRRAKGERVRFVPRKRRSYLLDQFPAVRQRVPLAWRVRLFIGSILNRLFLPLYFACGCTWVLVRNGLAQRLPVPLPWDVSQRIDGFLVNTRIKDHELIHDDGQLAPGRILHLLETEPSAGFWEEINKKGLRVVRPKNQRSPWSFVWRRLILGYFPLLVWNAILEMTVRNSAVDAVEAILRVGLYVLEEERLTFYYRPRVYFGWDSYSVQANIRSMVWERHGGRCVLYVHGAPWLPLYMYHNVYSHVLLCASKGIEDMFGKTFQHVERVLPVGLMTTELALPLSKGRDHCLRTDEPCSHLVAAFDSSYTPFWGLTHDVCESFYRALLQLVQRWPTVRLHLKRKYRHQENPGYDAIASQLEQHPRIRVLYEEDTYHLLASADSVIVITSCTVGWEGLSCHKPTLFYDPRERYQNHPFWKYGPPLVCHTVDELLDRFGQILQGRYLDAKALDRIVQYEARYVEERPLTAVRNLLLQEAVVTSPS